MSERTLYIEMHSGVSGDMLISALLDTGLVTQDFLLSELKKLAIPPIHMSLEKAMVSGLSATRVEFDVEQEASWSLGGGHHHTHEKLHTHSHEHNHTHEGHSHSHEHKHSHAEHTHNKSQTHSHVHRTYQDVVDIIDASSLSEDIKIRSKAIFKTLAIAEGAVHGMEYQKVHFHEVGSLDAICDVVGFCILLKEMGIQKIYSTPFILGRGTVRCAHGLMPVPVPAVVKMLEASEAPSSQVDENTGELTTPTGCAIVSTCVDEFRSPKSFKLTKVGYGAGKKVIPSRPNVLRVSVLEKATLTEANLDEDEVLLLQCNIDDMSAEILSDVTDGLMNVGALDVWTSPIVMKKGRSAVELSVLCDEKDANELGIFLLENTTTIGYRYTTFQRKKLKREVLTLEYRGEKVSAKKVLLPSGKSRIKVEYEDKKKLSKQFGMCLLEIEQELIKLI